LNRYESSLQHGAESSQFQPRVAGWELGAGANDYAMYGVASMNVLNYILKNLPKENSSDFPMF
jgi:hypothetical protein